VVPGLEHLWENKKEFRLGTTLPEAYTVWAARIAPVTKGRAIGELLDAYALRVVPKKAPKTQTENLRNITRLRAVFADTEITALTPQDVYQYVDNRGGKVIGHREIEVLSHACTKAVEWGWIARHPFIGQVRLEGEPARTRYIEDWEIVEALSLKSKRKRGSVLAIQASIRLKLLTGMARSDLLRLRPGRDFKEEGILIERHKTSKSTGKRTLYQWTPDLRAAVDQALAVRPVDIAPWLFCNRRGEGHFNEKTGTANGWDTMWGNFMKRVLRETKVTERFTEHDLRAKCASDAESLEHARALLSHADAKTTQRVYRRRPERVQPAPSKF
jgi:integrase